MHDLQLKKPQLNAIRNVWETKFARAYDPDIKYSVDIVRAPEGFEFSDILDEMRLHPHHIVFSALNARRKFVIDHIMNYDAFPARQFCSRSPRTVMQFIRGPRLPVRVGDYGQICILRDSKPIEVSSPSVTQLGEGQDAERLGSYLTTSNNVMLIAVVKVTVISTKKNKATAGVKKKKLKGKRKKGQEDTYMAKETDDETYRKVRKLRDKRMDNFGIKDDF